MAMLIIIEVAIMLMVMIEMVTVPIIMMGMMTMIPPRVWWH